VLWTRFAANGTVYFLATCFVEMASFALQSARFRNNAHVFRTKAHVRKTSEANVEPLGKATLAATRPSHLFLRAFKPAVCPPSNASNPSNPSVGLSKATLAATRPSHLFLRAFKRLPFASLQTLKTPKTI